MEPATAGKGKTAGAVVDESMFPVQPGPLDEQQAAAAEAIAAALDPALVSRLAAQVRTQGVQLLGRGGGAAAADEAVPGGRPGGGNGRAPRL